MKIISKNKTLLIFMTFLYLLLPITETIACGTVERFFNNYWKAKSPEAKERYLKRTSCREVINYYPHQDDPLIAKVMADAIENNLELELVNKNLKKYNCAYGARETQYYITVRSFIGLKNYDEFCDTATLKKAYIIKPKGGANMRSKPDSTASKVDSVRYGVLVHGLGVSGDWLQVRYLKKKGFIHKSLLTPY